ncbi:hypothetical protein SAMD00019534_052500 [Acytostelium subglobosum LB1]|uniref:hypothetical protein n=1 Tax=Acytostelium subglobosum LB1 TaxID=1410327 RepID=UPI000644C37B|nr:hypothetical protein SAMD00019534_052500 [Acytostelium subglobosum LB1]GAM22075.1 hypothetical protein SAMD00019534_052500 [Acytostelium subglobosum LB1]|eukprot:XP_012755175.1 hypothetical protein SAMD00019534_052500 [Acytostelium subglobosum LB1]
MNNNKSILFFKAPKDDTDVDPYQSLFEDHSYNVYFMPLLKITYCNVDRLKQCMVDNVDCYSSLVITSCNAVGTIKLMIDTYQDETTIDAIKCWLTEKKLYIVGQTSLNALKSIATSIGLNTSSLSHAVVLGNARSLAESIVQRQEIPTSESEHQRQRLLYPCGNLRRDELPTILVQGGCLVDEVTAYTTSTATNISGDTLIDALAVKTDNGLSIPPRLDWVVYFSPSGFECMSHLQQTHPLLSQAKIAVIGPTTGDAVLRCNNNNNISGNRPAVSATASLPTPESLLYAITLSSDQDETVHKS